MLSTASRIPMPPPVPVRVPPDMLIDPFSRTFSVPTDVTVSPEAML